MNASIITIVEGFAKSKKVSKASVMMLAEEILAAAPQVQATQKEKRNVTATKGSIIKNAIESMDNFTVKELSNIAGTSMIYTRLIVNQYTEAGKVTPTKIVPADGKGRTVTSYVKKA